MAESNYSIGFQSQETEISIDHLGLKGTMPTWLTGDLIRTTPSKFETDKRQYNHWFDGLAMLHKFSFKKGEVSYACKFLQSKAYRLFQKKNKIVYGEFGTDPCRDLFQRVFSFFKGPEPTDNGCVNIIAVEKGLAATTETTSIVPFQLNNLLPKAPYRYEDHLGGKLTIAHPHYDKEGTLFSYLIDFGYKTYYHIYSQAKLSHRRNCITSIPVAEPAYMHSIGMTENYIILAEFPLVTQPLKLRFSSKPFIENYSWKPQRGTTIYMIEKKRGTTHAFKTEAFFAFHHVNAFEQNGDVVFDIVAYDNPDIIRQLYLNRLRHSQQNLVWGQLRRYAIALSLNKIYHEVLSPVAFELPRIHYAKINCQPYRYVYGAGTTIPNDFLDNITKIDVSDRSANAWYEKDCYPGEPVFVEHPSAQKEDDGVLLSVVLDAKRQTSFLLILDAKNLLEIARAEVPQHITFGFHGQYVQNNKAL